MNIQTIEDVSDCVPLYLPQSLHLKPIARINMSVALPSKITGKSISNYDIMERMRNIILPDRFSVLRVSKSTIEFIRFEAELESRSKLRVIIEKLDGRPIKLPGFSESVRIKAAEAKDDFPTRHDWDSFFRDAANMDELKAGERPDTIHFINLPIKWFAPRHHENEENVKPSESIFKRIFEKFGAVAHVDIPICDPYRNKMKAHISGMQTYSYEQDVFFEGYIQFGEYIGFVKCMDEFRGMRLVRKEGDKNSVVNIKVNFDKTKHLSDNSIKRRKAVRERLMAKDREREEEEMKKQLVEAEKLEKERRRDEMKRLADLEKQQTREAKRKEKHLKKLREREVTDISSKIKAEEIKLLETQRKLESVRLLEGVFDRISLKKKHKEIFNKGGTSASTLEFDLRNSATATSKEERHSITNKYKEAAEEELHKIRVRVNKARDDNLLKNFLGQNRSRSSSMVSISSNDSILSESNKKKKKKRKKDDSASSDDEKETSKFPGMYPGMMPMPDGMDWSAWMPYMMSMGGYFPSMGYRPYRGRGRGRGGYRGRGRGGYYGGDYDNHGHDDRYSRSYSRSRSRSRGRYRRKRRSRSRSRSTRRSDSRSRSRSRRHSHSRSRSKSQTRNRKLVSTRRSRNSWSSRSRSPDYKRRGDRKRRSTWSREGSPQKKANASPENSHTPTQKVTLQPEKLLKTAKEIQRSVQQKLKERLDEEESMRKSIMEHEEIEKRAAELTKNRSPSADSSKFISPKRAAKSQTPDKLYSD